MKHLNYLWLAGFACLASCSSDEYLGEQSNLAQNGMKEISFASNTPNVTRTNADGITAANLLGRQFNVYGAKQTSKDNDDNSLYSVVFNNYSVWYDGLTSSSNSKGWEYVGAKPNFEAVSGVNRQKPDFTTAQTIKYWDYSAEDYWFYAISGENNTTTPKENFTFNAATGADENGLVTTATINNVGEVNTVFYADAVHLTKGTSGNFNYATHPASGQTGANGEVVTFTFKRLQSKVRVGFYETIPGYAVSEMKFYAAGTTPATADQPIPFGSADNEGSVILVTSAKTSDASKISKGFMPSTSDNVYTITYNSTDGKASIANTKADLAIASSKTFGKLNYANALDITGSSANYLGETSITPTWATHDGGTTASGSYLGNGTNGNYWLVLPNEDVNQYDGFKIKVDYTLTSIDKSKETIKVTGAEAVVPANYCKWAANTAYTYLFKISDNTNGTTGDPEQSDPKGLYPITFDAVVADVTDATQGTTTLVSDYSITTYQDGSVEDNGISYKAGENIVVTILKTVDGTAATGGTLSIVYIPTSGTEGSNVLSSTTLSDGKYTITSPKEGIYAVTYTDASSNTYTKMIHVGADDNGETDPVSTILTVASDIITLPKGAVNIIVMKADTEDGTYAKAISDTDYSSATSSEVTTITLTTDGYYKVYYRLNGVYYVSQAVHKETVTP